MAHSTGDNLQAALFTERYGYDQVAVDLCVAGQHHARFFLFNRQVVGGVDKQFSEVIGRYSDRALASVTGSVAGGFDNYAGQP